MSHQDVDVDVVIVGARCAGTAAAAVLARAGRSVLLLDKADLPSETLSSHTMFSGTMDEIRRMGAEDHVYRLVPPDLRTMKLHSRAGGRSGHFVESWAADAKPAVTSLRRYLLDQALLECAVDAGAQVRTRARVEEIVWRGGRAAGVVASSEGKQATVTARLVLGADGQFSTVADLVGSSEPYRWSRSPRAAMLRYYVDPATEEPEASTVHHSRVGSSLAFVFPTAPRGQTVVMFIDDRFTVEDARSRPEEAWAEVMALHPEVEARFRDATEREPVRFHDELTSYFRRATGPGWGLIGDAGHFKDPIIGQGIRDALWSGRTLAERVQPVLDSPNDLDVALRRWEHERERECRAAYLAAVLESRTWEDSDGLLRMMDALDARRVRIVDALGSRGDDMLSRLPRRAILGALYDAARDSPHPVSTLRDLGSFAGGFASAIHTLRRQPFRGSDPHPWEMPVRADLGKEVPA